MKPLAVRRPPTIAQGKTTNETIHAHSVSTADRARKAERQRQQQDRTREPFDQKRAQTPSRLPKPKIGRPGRTLTGAALG